VRSWDRRSRHRKGLVSLGTETSSFGVSKREGHDSSRFYNSRLYQDKRVRKTPSSEINKVPPDVLDRVYCGDSRDMSQIPDNSVALMVTSPPYNVGKDYDEDLTLDEYCQMLAAVFTETYRVLLPGGRAAVNVANLGRKPYIPLHSYIISIMEDIGYLMRGEIIWSKAASPGGSCAWGSWKSASNPTLRDIHEYILVFSKEEFGRDKKGKESSISKEEFLEFTQSIWDFPPEFAKNVGHPAPFPVELPYRLIQLYTFIGDVVLDPFCGSGSTCIAALQTQRSYIGYDISEEYVALSNQRIQEYRSRMARKQVKLWEAGT